MAAEKLRHQAGTPLWSSSCMVAGGGGGVDEALLSVILLQSTDRESDFAGFKRRWVMFLVVVNRRRLPVIQ